jgi:hypothetical protein
MADEGIRFAAKVHEYRILDFRPPALSRGAFPERQNHGLPNARWAVALPLQAARWVGLPPAPFPRAAVRDQKLTAKLNDDQM